MELTKCWRGLGKISVFFLVFGLVLVLASSPVTAEGDHRDMIRAAGVLRIAVNPGIEPMEYRRDGQLVGYDIDVGVELARRLNVEAKWIEFESFDELVKLILDGEFGKNIDVVISAMGVDHERTENSVAVPYFKSGLTILANASATQITTLESLKGYTVAAVRGSTEFALVKQMPEVTVMEAKGYDECVALVLSGEVSAAVLDVPVALLAAKRYEDQLRIAGHPFVEGWYGIYMDRSELALFREVRKAVKAMRRDGTLDRLNAKWF